jgi:L-lysine exporter family protein LysE/ArgO
MSSGALGAFVSGLGFGLSLIVAIGAQNAFVLRQGALRQHVPVVILICSVSDAVLIAFGVAGAGAALSGRPWLLSSVRVLGATALLAYAGYAARRALAQPDVTHSQRPDAGSRKGVIAACLAFTWLNPAVYLDTVVLLGSVANARPGREWWFGGGATAGSIVWFTALGFGAGLLGPVLKRPGPRRVLDAFVALVMTATAARVLLAA